MNIRKLALALGITLMCSTPVLAANTTTVYDGVTTVRVDAGYGYNVVLKTAKQACGGFSRSYFLLPATANSAAMFSLLTAAYLSGTNVQITYDCSGGQARLTQVSAGVE